MTHFTVSLTSFKHCAGSTPSINEVGKILSAEKFTMAKTISEVKKYWCVHGLLERFCKQRAILLYIQ